MKNVNHIIEVIAGTGLLLLVIENPSLVTKVISTVTSLTNGVLGLAGVSTSGAAQPVSPPEAGHPSAQGNV